MSTPTREISIVYAGYTATNLTEYYVNKDGPDMSLLGFEFEINDPDPTAFQGKVLAARTAFRTPRQACIVTCRGKTLESFSHTSGTGFNSNPEIAKEREGSSANSRFFTVSISFGRPADVHATSYRRNSTVRVTWTTDRRMNVDIDGVYTVNGSMTARDQYLSAIGAYATAIFAELSLVNYDLLEENVINDDQNKVATFHRKYVEQIAGRNWAEIVIETLPNTRKRVTITGEYSTILLNTSSFAAYESLYPAFSAAVLAAVGGEFEAGSTKAEHNDTDLVTTFTNVYEEMLDGFRQDGNYQIFYATDRRITLTVNATYFTGLSGTSARTEAESDFPAWVASIVSSVGGTFNKVSESYTPNDVVPPNICIAKMELLEYYVEQAPGLPVGVSDQNYKVTRKSEGPGDSGGAGTKRIVELSIEFTAHVDHLTVGMSLKLLWQSIKAWILATVVSQYQDPGVGGIAVVEETPTFNPDNSIISAMLKVWVAPSSNILYRLEISESVDQGKVFDPLWTGNALDFDIYDGHIIALRKVTKTYRRIIGTAIPAPEINMSLLDADVPSLPSGTGEGGDDPFGMGMGSMFATVIFRDQPKKTTQFIGIDPNQIQVEDITVNLVLRVTNQPAEYTG